MSVKANTHIPGGVVYGGVDRAQCRGRKRFGDCESELPRARALVLAQRESGFHENAWDGECFDDSDRGGLDRRGVASLESRALGINSFATSPVQPV